MNTKIKDFFSEMNKKKIAILVAIVLGACIVLGSIATGIYFGVTTIPCKGIVTDASGSPIADVSITDGKNVVKTDSTGAYKLDGWHKAKFVTVTIPSGYWTEDYYLPISRDTESYDFKLDKVNTDQTNHSFIQITDSEIGKEGADKHRWYGELKQMVEEQKPAFIMHTGDICYEDGLRQHIKDMNSENMGVPVRYAIGNHDYTTIGDSGEWLFESIYGPAMYSFEVGNVHYIVTPMTRYTEHPTRYSDSDVWRWVDNDLKNVSPDKKIVMFNHDTINGSEKGEFTVKHGLNKIDLREKGLIAWVYGHMHMNVANNMNGVWSICTTSSSTGGMDSTPAALRTIEINGGEVVNTTLNYLYDDIATETGYTWQKQLSGRGLFAEPIIKDDKIYIATTGDGLPKKQIVACLDAKTGEELWIYHPDNSVGNNITLAGDKLVFQDMEGFVYCINANTGEEIWQKDSGIGYIRHTNIAVAVDEDKVYCGDYGEVYCRNLSDGEKVWSTKIRPSEGSPMRITVHGDNIYISCLWRPFTAINKNTGKKAWENKDIRNCQTEPLLDGDNFITLSESKLFKIDGKTGKTLLSKDITSTDKDGKEIKFSLDTVSKPTLVDGIYYLGTTNAGVIAVNSETFEVVWNYETGNSLIFTSAYTSESSKAVEGTICIIDNYAVFGASDGYLYCVDKANGELIDKFLIGSPILTKVQTYEDQIIVLDFGGKVTSIKFANGIFGI